MLDCFAAYARRKVKRVFEPACGTGRLLIKLAQAGYDVAGNDLNPKAVDYCNDRFARYGFAARATVGDMSDFTVARPFDAGFNMINSVPASAHRSHWPAEHSMHGPRRRTRRPLSAGTAPHSDAGAALRGRIVVGPPRQSAGQLLHVVQEASIRKKRNEELGMTFDVYTPTNQFRIEDEMNYRTYTAAQLKKLLASVPAWEVAAVHDFHYRVSIPVEIGPSTEDVVLVLRRR